MTELTQEYLQSIYNYNPETGSLTYKNRTANNAAVGQEVGCLTSDGYRQASINNKSYRVHRLLFLYMTGFIPKIVDHVDMDKLNNRWSNLRAATSSQNSCNTLSKITNTSGVKGLVHKYFLNQYCTRVKYKGQVYTKTKTYYSEEDRLEVKDFLTTWLKAKRLELHKDFANNG